MFTKADKERKSRKIQQKASVPGAVGRGTSANIAAFMQQLDMRTPPNTPMPEAFVTSAAEGSGARDLLRHVAALRDSWLAEHGFGD